MKKLPRLHFLTLDDDAHVSVIGSLRVNQATAKDVALIMKRDFTRTVQVWENWRMVSKNPILHPRKAHCIHCV